MCHFYLFCINENFFFFSVFLDRNKKKFNKNSNKRVTIIIHFLYPLKGNKESVRSALNKEFMLRKKNDLS